MRAFTTPLLLAPALLLLACNSQPAPESTVVIPEDRASSDRLRGQVFYVDRRALSDRAELIVELRDADANGHVRWVMSRPLKGQQVPISFEMRLSEHLNRSMPLRLRAAIVEPGGAVRIGSLPSEFTPDERDDIGSLQLHFMDEEDLQASYRCGERVVGILSIGDRLVLVIDDEVALLDRMVTASGARYRNEEIEFWEHQATARLIIDGRELPECSRVDTSRTTVDGLTDMDWLVTEIDGQNPVTDSEPELRFLSNESRVAGTAGCNRFGASYSLVDQNIELGAMMSTMMACPEEAIDDQERRMTDALSAIDRYEIVEGPELRLFEDDRVRLRARPKTE
ncbi:MAG: META domain-containing protein [Wenzhouxiangella sp.]|jgi:heat shock protein HslJ/uncharacterized lipoprotein YbaY|nr:META domain-containing protein [Wenzhouxiangella sp.]